MLMKTKLFLLSLILLPMLGQTQVVSEKISKNLLIEGDWCDGYYMLIADFGNKPGVWQWYKDGVIIEDAIENSINLTTYGNGKYTVMYKLENNKTIFTDEYEFKTLPGVKADYSFTYLYAASAIQFKNNTTGNTANYTWLWNFGDGTTSTEMSPVHLYKEEKTYVVTLTVTDEGGCSNTMTLNIVWDFPG
jgi:PKD repeat protein